MGRQETHRFNAKNRPATLLSTRTPIVDHTTRQYGVLSAIQGQHLGQGPSPTNGMQSVCDTPSEAWNLPVLCDCMTEDERVCQRTCTSPSLTAMGFTVHLGNDCPPLVYAQPSGLIAIWRLKYTVTLQSPPAQAHKHVSNILVSAVLNVQPFLHTRASCLLSITAWAQVAILSGYSQPTVLRALHSAVPRIVARTLWDVDQTCEHIAYKLPSTRETIFFHLHRWLQSHAIWSENAYASLHMPHAGPCNAHCADWCHNFPILSALTPLLNPSTRIPVGLSPPGEGPSLFPIL